MVMVRSGERRRVLVVEDEMLLVLMIEATLHDLGAEVVGPAAQLQTALKLATEEAIDAAILDINIRDGSSYAVADILAGRGVPFMFSSGYGDWAVEARYRDRPHLPKPYDANELAEQVLELLGEPRD